MKLFAAIALNVLFSVGGFLALQMLGGVSYFVSFLIFLLVLIPLANFIVSIALKVNVLTRFFA